MPNYRTKMWAALVIALCAWTAGSGCQKPSLYPESVGPTTTYSRVVEALTTLIEHEMETKGLPALSIVVVDDQKVVWARGFGLADPDLGIPATARTAYRVGSVSKLFTDIAIMRMVERQEIELDTPIGSYLPHFEPKSSFGKEITLRQLMSHRAGLVREPPVGNYFDDTEPSLDETVASLNETALVYEPESRTKYSNAGIAVVGRVLEKGSGVSFEEYLKSNVLEPLEMERSGFRRDAEIKRTLATAYMWTYDGREFEAPGFQLGMAPAGSMYSNVLDLGKFMKCLLRGGEIGRGRLLEEETLEAMYSPQFGDSAYGLGFAISELDGHRLIRHGGAIYGFATELAFLPEKKLGVAVVTTMDGANSVMSRIAQQALRGAIAAQEDQELPETQLTRALEPELARKLAGRYETAEGGEAVELLERAGRLWLQASDLIVEIRALEGNRLIVDDRLSYGLELSPRGDETLHLKSRDFVRAIVKKPAPVPERWRGLIGEYGWDYNTLYILEKDGRLHALIEWFFLYPLEQLSENLFAFPDSGLYEGEQLIFIRDDEGVATEVLAANVGFKRRSVGTEEGKTFQIEPLQPVDGLREVALAAKPPLEEGDFRRPELIEVVTLDRSIQLDVRYATTNNFMGAVFYDEPKAFLQQPAAEALVAAHRALNTEGYGILIHDAYRPWYVTKMFWDATPESQKIFVANPENGSRHNRGAAVDVTLYDLENGKPVRMVGGYDEFSERSYPGYLGGTSLERWQRELLRHAMEAKGFEVYEFEWWHFDYKDWNRYPILNLSFDQLEVQEPVH